MGVRGFQEELKKVRKKKLKNNEYNTMIYIDNYPIDIYLINDIKTTPITYKLEFEYNKNKVSIEKNNEAEYPERILKFTLEEGDINIEGGQGILKIYSGEELIIETIYSKIEEEKEYIYYK